MTWYPDTSFLCSLYRKQVHSPRAIAFMQALASPLPVSSLLLLEFRQSVRLQSRLHARDKSKGFSNREANLMLRDLQSDLAAKVIAVAPADWAEVHQLAEGLSAKYTDQNGHRLADLSMSGPHCTSGQRSSSPSTRTKNCSRRPRECGCRAEVAPRIAEDPRWCASMKLACDKAEDERIPIIQPPSDVFECSHETYGCRRLALARLQAANSLVIPKFITARAPSCPWNSSSLGVHQVH